MFIIRKEQLEVFRAPLRQKKRDKLLLNLRSAAGNKVASQKDKVEVTDKKGRVSTLHYSEKNLLHAFVKPSGTRYEFDYNQDDRLSKVAFPGNESLILEYRQSLPIKVMLNGAKLELQYDTKGRISHIIYPDKKGVQFQYHANNQVAAIIDRTNAKKSYYTTIEDNRLVHLMKDALGRETTVFMNTAGNPERIVFPDKSRQETRYDKVLDAERVTLRNGTERITYFDERHARRVEWEDGSYQKIGVNDKQLISSLENATGTIVYEHDEKGRLLSESFAASEVRYRYDNDHLERMIYPGGLEVMYTYDEDARLKTMQVGNQTCNYDYASNGTLAGVRYPNGLTENREQQVLGGLRDIRLTDRSGKQLYRHHYQYDELFRLTDYQEFEQADQPLLRALSYDDESRLTQITDRATGKGEHFRYDAKGNIVAAGQQKVVVGVMDEVRSIDGEEIIYDEAGNVTWFTDEAGRQIRLKFADDGTLKLARVNGETWEYWYDAKGRRVAKSNGKVTFRYFWSGKKLLQETLKGGERTTVRAYIYTTDDIPIAFTEEGRLFWLHRDVRGAIIRVYDNMGNLAWKADYTAFGKALISVDKIRQPWRLTGQYHDDETGLHYNYARYYSTYLRSFLSLDPKWFHYEASNYSYAANDPYNKVDVDGNMAALALLGGGSILAAIGAAIAPLVVPVLIVVAVVLVAAIIWKVVEGSGADGVCKTCPANPPPTVNDAINDKTNNIINSSSAPSAPAAEQPKAKPANAGSADETETDDQRKAREAQERIGRNAAKGKRGEEVEKPKIVEELKDGEILKDKPRIRTVDENGKVTYSYPDHAIVDAETGEIKEFKEIKTGDGKLTTNQDKLQKHGGTWDSRKMPEYNGAEVGPGKIDIRKPF